MSIVTDGLCDATATSYSADKVRKIERRIGEATVIECSSNFVTRILASENLISIDSILAAHDLQLYLSTCLWMATFAQESRRPVDHRV